MVFASPLFLFLFLPATIAAYFALPARFRNATLLAASLVFYAWDEVRYVPLVLAAIPLPLGISFFTFHAISYVVDVYKRTASAQRNVPEFALYILLFPQLIAGPIFAIATSPRSSSRATRTFPNSRTACAASSSGSARSSCSRTRSARRRMAYSRCRPPN
jgi:D-alanyl-lipoteichoic acid acyltransferase DltB (MBOAT superfamily)